MSPTTQSRYPSPLRYPGGQGKVFNFLRLLLLENEMIGTDYIEPYAGGASAALGLLFEDYVANSFKDVLSRPSLTVITSPASARS